MAGCIFTMLFCIVAIILYTQPIMSVYGLSSDGSLDIIDINQSAFDFISFRNGQDDLHTVISILLILTLIFCCLTLLFSFITIILKATNKNNLSISTKVFAFLFTLFTAISLMLIQIYISNNLGETIMEYLNRNGITLSISFSMIATLTLAILSWICAPKKYKINKKEVE